MVHCSGAYVRPWLPCHNGGIGWSEISRFLKNKVDEGIDAMRLRIRVCFHLTFCGSPDVLQNNV